VLLNLETIKRAQLRVCYNCSSCISKLLVSYSPIPLGQGHSSFSPSPRREATISSTRSLGDYNPSEVQCDSSPGSIAVYAFIRTDRRSYRASWSMPLPKSTRRSMCSAPERFIARPRQAMHLLTDCMPALRDAFCPAPLPVFQESYPSPISFANLMI
jgi:hypothetical protein